MGLEVPNQFGGIVAKKLHRAECKACGDFGTLARGDRRDTVAAILNCEIPCVCKAGALWKELEIEWSKPLEAGGKAGA